MPFFDLIIRWVESSDFGSSDFGPKSDDLGYGILKSDFFRVGFCKIGLHKQAHLFFRSKNKSQKLGIRSRIINGLIVVLTLYLYNLDYN